jgi:colicin import membrane protein
MNKVYIIVPLICTLIFGGFYYSFDKNYAAKQAEIAAKADAELKAKVAKDIADRAKAIEAAVEASKKREAERKERDRIAELKATARQEAEDRRQKTYDERNRARDQVVRLKKDLEEVKGTFGKLEEEKKKHLDEQAFLKTYVKQAEANVKYYYDLLEKIDASEKAKAAAAAAAAAAAKKG